jgi:hypothetical protein
MGGPLTVLSVGSSGEVGESERIQIGHRAPKEMQSIFFPLMIWERLQREQV